MGVRLNKVLTELEIGLQQAVDFLKARKGELGDIRDDASPNTKISDEQYEALVKDFKGNKYIKKQANLLFPKKPQTIKCTRMDVNGMACGHMNDYNNTYCVKCGRVLEGKKKVEIIETEAKNALEQRNHSLVEKNEKLQKQNKTYERQIQDLKREYEKTIRYLTEENKRLSAFVEDVKKRFNG
jgi:hypothetical protein